MDTVRINILNPKARKLLEDLEALNLISIDKDENLTFKELVHRLRNKAKSSMSIKDITIEVEDARANRYGKKS